MKSNLNLKSLRLHIDAKRHFGLRGDAEQIGISAATLSRVIRGYTPDLETFARIIIWLGVEADRFIKNDNRTNNKE